MELTVGGKAVVLRESIPASVAWGLVPIVSKVSAGDNLFKKLTWPEAVAVLTAVIESWELEGDPTQPEAYDDLTLDDGFVDFFPLFWAHVIGLFNRVADALGESTRESTSPSED